MVVDIVIEGVESGCVYYYNGMFVVVLWVDWSV